MASFARLLSRIGLGLAAMGLVSCVINLFGYEVRALRALDTWGPLAAWGFRIGLVVVGSLLAVVGLFLDPEGDPEKQAEAALATSARRANETRSYAADARIVPFLEELAKQAQISLDVPTDPAVYHVARILWTNAAGGWFRSDGVSVLGAGDPAVTGAIACLVRTGEQPTHVLAGRSFTTGQSYVQPTDANTWGAMAHAGDA